MYRFQWIQYAWSYCGLFLLKDASCSQYILEIHFFFSFLKLYISPQSSEDWLWQANAAWHSSQSVGVIYIQCVYQKLCYNVTTGHNGSHIDRIVRRQIKSTCLPSCWIIMGSSFSGSSKLKKKKNPGYGIKERQLLVCLFSWVSIRLYSPIKGLPINF